MIFTWTIHPHCHFKPVLILHRNRPIDLLYKCFLYNDNTANLRHHIHLYYFRLSWRYSWPLSPSVQLGRPISQKNTEKIPKNSHKQFYVNLETYQIKTFNSPNLLKDNNFILNGYYQSKYILNPAYKTLHLEYFLSKKQ